MTNYEWPTANSQAAARRNSQRKAQPAQKWYIEGDYVTCAEIAARLCVVETTAASRLRRLQKASGPITWQRLRTGAA